MRKERTNFSSKGGIFVKRRACFISKQHSSCSAHLNCVWMWDFSETLRCTVAVGCPKAAFLQKSPFCFIVWDFTTAELFLKLNYFSYLFWSNTLRGFVKINPAFITSCSLLDNLGIILLLISPVEMKLLWIGICLVEANIQTAAFSTTGKDASLQSPQISFEWESCRSCLSARDWTA